MTLVITHSVVQGGTVDTTSDVDGAAWDANHTLTGVVSASQGGTGVANNDASTITISGSFGLTFTISAATSLTFPTTGTVATLAGTENLTNKTLNNTNTVTLKDTLFTLQDDGDVTKQFKFDISAVATGTTRTWTVPNTTDSFLGQTSAQTVSNKTLDNSNIITLRDDRFTLQDSADTTKQAVFQLSGITTATTRTYTVPDADGTLLYAGGPLGTPASGVGTNLTGVPISTGLAGAGTGVLTALGVNVGTAGSFVTNGGALGTPSSGVGTNITGVNAATLGGATFAAPGTIGGGTPNSGIFTTGSFTSIGSSDNITTTFSTNGSAHHIITNSNGGASAQARYIASNGTNQAEYGQRGTAQTAYGILTANRTYMYAATDVAFVADGADFYFGGAGGAQTARHHGDATNLGNLEIVGSFGTRAPVTLTGTSGTVTAVQGSVIVNASGAFTITLPAAASYSGHWIWIKSIAAQTIASATSNVVPRAGGAAGTALLASGAGNWANLQSDGTNWITMAGS